MPIGCAGQRPELVFQTDHSSNIASVAFSPDGKVFATGSWDNTVKLWEVSRGYQLRTLVGHEKQVDAVAFSPDGKILASGSWDKTIRLWDPTSGALLHVCQGHRDRVETIAFSPNGKILASGNSADYDKIRFWDVGSGAEIHALANRPNGINAIAFSPDARFFATAGYKTITLWDAATYAEIRSWDGHTDRVSAIVFSPDSKTLISGSWDKTVKVWNVTDGVQQKSLTLLAAVTAMALGSDGRALAVDAQRAVRVWDLASSNELRIINLPGAAEQVTALAFSPNGTTLAGGSRSGTHSIFLRFWDAATGTEIHSQAANEKPVRAIAISPDGRRLASGGGYLRLWDILGNTEPRTLSPLDDLASFSFSPNGKRLATLGRYKDSLDLWDVERAEVVRSLSGGSSLISSLALSADEKTLASYSTIDQAIVLWDITSGKQLRTIRVGSSGLDNKIVFSPDGKSLATGSPDNTIKLWNVADGKTLRVFNGGTLFSNPSAIAFSPDGLLLAGGGYNSIKVWEVANGTEIKSLVHSRQVRSVAFSSDGKLLVSGGDDHTVKIWDSKTGTLLHQLMGHAAEVNTVAFSPSGSLLITGSSDATIKLWDVASGQELGTLRSLDKSGWLVVTPEGLFDGTSTAWRDVIWRFDNNTSNIVPVEAFFNDYYHPGLLNDLFAGRHPKPPADIQQKDRRQPQLKISTIEVQSKAGLTTRTIPVKISISEAAGDGDHKTGSGARDVRLFRNGSLVKVWHGDVLNGKNNVTLETVIPIVSGENKVTAYAFNHDNIKSSDAELTVIGAESLQRRGTAYILTIGVNEYANPEFRLNYAVADAEDFGLELKRRQEQLQTFDRVVVTSLLDKDATKEKILQTLAALGDQAQPEDIVIVYFAGHGRAEGKQFYLIPHDLGYSGARASLDAAGFQTIFAHSVSDRDMEKSFEGIDARQVVLIIDACNSGQALESDESRRGPMNSKGLAQLAYEKGMYILTASQSFEEAKEDRALGHGYLTYALVESGLKKGAADRAPRNNKIDLREWLDYAAEEVPEMQKRFPALSPNESSQQPRVFYRRELEPNPLVVAIVGAPASQ